MPIENCINENLGRVKWICLHLTTLYRQCNTIVHNNDINKLSSESGTKPGSAAPPPPVSIMASPVRIIAFPVRIIASPVRIIASPAHIIAFPV